MMLFWRYMPAVSLVVALFFSLVIAHWTGLTLFLPLFPVFLMCIWSFYRHGCLSFYFLVPFGFLCDIILLLPPTTTVLLLLAGRFSIPLVTSMLSVDTFSRQWLAITLVFMLVAGLFWLLLSLWHGFLFPVKDLGVTFVFHCLLIPLFSFLIRLGDAYR